MYLWGYSTEGLPDEVRIPSEIGVKHFYHKNGAPCCGMGHFSFVVSGNAHPWADGAFQMGSYQLLDRLYFAAFEVQSSCHDSELVSTQRNDLSKAEQRMDAYCATWSAAGYNLVGFDKKDRDRITRLARKVKKWMNEWIAPGVPRS